MERGEWEDDPEYPGAPLPAHERSWRHPSEMGATNWVQSEPPLVVGRGLSVATGTVGAILAVGLLWLMVPHQNDGGVAVEESTTSTRTASAPEALSRETATSQSVAATTVAPTTDPAPATTMTSTTERPQSTTSTSAPSVVIPATSTSVDVEAPPPVPTAKIEKEDDAHPVPAIAVALRAGHFVVTTAAAVGGRIDLQVQLPTGDIVTGSVVAIDAASGAAVLSVPTEIDASRLEPSEQAVPVTSAQVMSPDGTAVRLWEDETGIRIESVTPDSNFAADEGALVIDSDGRLLGICTTGENGMHLVGVGDLITALDGAAASEASTTTSSTTTTTQVPTAWLGIRAQVAENGLITVYEVALDSPAAVAGIVPGDVVTAVDGIAIPDRETLTSIVMSHSIGDVVTLTIIKPGATTPVDIAVTLIARPWSL